MQEKSEPLKVEVSATADLSKSANKTINNIFNHSSKNVGKALSNVTGLFYTATLPIQLLNKYAVKNYQLLESKIDNITEEEIREVEPEIAVPIMEKLSYTSNEELAEAYAKLLAKASNKKSIDLVHPGFIMKINSMAPDETKILELFMKNDLMAYVQFHVKHQTGGSLALTYKLTGFEQELGLSSEVFNIHLENLISLQLVQDFDGSYLVDNKIYEEIEKKYSNMEDLMRKRYDDTHTLDKNTSYYKLSQMGAKFISACIKE